MCSWEVLWEITWEILILGDIPLRDTWELLLWEILETDFWERYVWRGLERQLSERSCVYDLYFWEILETDFWEMCLKRPWEILEWAHDLSSKPWERECERPWGIVLGCMWTLRLKCLRLMHSFLSAIFFVWLKRRSVSVKSFNSISIRRTCRELWVKPNLDK